MNRRFQTFGWGCCAGLEASSEEPRKKGRLNILSFTADDSTAIRSAVLAARCPA
jgi:hypothetical protein